MRWILVAGFALLFMLQAGVATAQQGKGKSKGPNQSGYDHANEKSKILRDESTLKEKGEETAAPGKEKAQDAVLTGESKKKEVQDLGKTNDKGKKKGKGKKNSD